MSEEFISLNDAARGLGTTRDYLNVLIHRGKLKGKKLGRNWVTTQGWVDEYRAARSAPAIASKPAISPSTFAAGFAVVILLTGFAAAQAGLPDLARERKADLTAIIARTLKQSQVAGATQTITKEIIREIRIIAQGPPGPAGPSGPAGRDGRDFTSPSLQAPEGSAAIPSERPVPNDNNSGQVAGAATASAAGQVNTVPAPSPSIYYVSAPAVNGASGLAGSFKYFSAQDGVIDSTLKVGGSTQTTIS